MSKKQLAQVTMAQAQEMANKLNIPLELWVDGGKEGGKKVMDVPPTLAGGTDRSFYLHSGDWWLQRQNEGVFWLHRNEFAPGNLPTPFSASDTEKWMQNFGDKLNSIPASMGIDFLALPSPKSGNIPDPPEVKRPPCPPIDEVIKEAIALLDPLLKQGINPDKAAQQVFSQMLGKYGRPFGEEGDSQKLAQALNAHANSFQPSTNVSGEPAPLALSAEMLAEARAWINDCRTGEEDFDDADELSDRQVESMIRRYYDGGIRQFLINSTPSVKLPQG